MDKNTYIFSHDIREKYNPKDYIINFDISYDYESIDTKNYVKKVRFNYINNKNGQKKYNTVTVYGTAYGGQNDSPKLIENKAYQDAIRNAVEKVNGIYIEGNSIVINGLSTRWSRSPHPVSLCTPDKCRVR